MSLAIVPGSFDPMTLGHLELVRAVARMYDEVVVAVMINPAKKYLFDMETRVEIARLTVSELRNVRVISEKGLLIDLFDTLGADAVCKGWRNDADYAYEIKMADWNRDHNPRFVTKLFRSHGDTASLSSTEVREALLSGNAPTELVHADALPLIIGKLKQS